MQNGTFVFYTIQSRMTHMSPDDHPDKPLVKIEFMWDGFGKPYENTWSSELALGSGGKYIAEPWCGTGNNYKPKYKKSHDQMHDVWSKTGCFGWWDLKYAIRGMQRVKKASEQGKLGYKDRNNKLTQIIRYEFRIAKISVSKLVEIVTCDELIDNVCKTF